MSRCGWQAVLALSSSAAFLVFGQSCSAGDATDDLFESERLTGGVGASGGVVGATGGRNQGGSGGTRPASGGASLGPGGELGDGGEPAASGGRNASGGRPGSGGRGGKGGGGAPVSAKGGAAGNATGGLSNTGGSEPSEGGSGGAEMPVDCNDDDPCTIDEPDTEGGCHSTPKCSAQAACEVAACDPSNGECSSAPAPDATPCDDGQSCTSADVCQNGSCEGVSSALTSADTQARDIPDGAEECTGDQPLIIDFNLTGGGVATSVELALEFRHADLSDLRGTLLHVPSGRTAMLFDDGDANGIEVDGEYVFASGAPDFVATGPDSAIPPERYSAVNDLGTFFDGVAAEGTWRLFIIDFCLGDEGDYVDSALRVERACATQ